MTDQMKTVSPTVPPTFLEELEVTGTELVSRVRQLAHEGQARRVTILTEEGEELISMSLTVGTVAGGLVAISAPALAALGALAALVTHVRVVVTREPDTLVSPSSGPG